MHGFCLFLRHGLGDRCDMMIVMGIGDFSIGQIADNSSSSSWSVHLGLRSGPLDWLRLIAGQMHPHARVAES